MFLVLQKILSYRQRKKKQKQESCDLYTPHAPHLRAAKKNEKNIEF